MTKKKNSTMKRTSALFGAIAMVMVAVFMIVGVTFAWFTTAADPRVSQISARVTGAGNLMISTRRDGSFTQNLEWDRITGVDNTNQRHAQTRTSIDEGLTPVTPIAIDRVSAYEDAGNWYSGAITGHDLDITNVAQPAVVAEQSNRLTFAEGMAWNDGLFSNWFNNYFVGTMVDGTAITAGDFAQVRAVQMLNPYAHDLTGGTLGTIGTRELAPGAGTDHLLDWGSGRFYSYSALHTPMSGDGSIATTITDDSNFIFFPLYFRSTVPMNIYLDLHHNPSALTEERGARGDSSRTYFRSDNPSNIFPQDLLDLSLRVAFFQHAITGATVINPDATTPAANLDRLTVFRPNTDMTGRFTVGAAENFRGNAVDAQGGGHIIHDIYDVETHATAVQHTAIPGSPAGRRLPIGRTVPYNTAAAGGVATSNYTITRVDVYIWVDGNDLFNTPHVANSIFEANLQFHGREAAMPATDPIIGGATQGGVDIGNAAGDRIMLTIGNELGLDDPAIVMTLTSTGQLGVPVIWSIVGANHGLTINAISGIITGLPTGGVSGDDFVIIIRATNASDSNYYHQVNVYFEWI